MNSFTTPTWGYKLISQSRITFYHVLLPKVDLSAFEKSLKYVRNIKKHRDGSISVFFPPDTSHEAVIEEIRSYFDKKENTFIETPQYHYKVDKKLRQTLKQWYLAFEGCLGLMLIHDEKVNDLFSPNWDFVNSSTGGIRLEPFTIHLFTDHAKVSEPVTVQNYDTRKLIELTAAAHIRTFIRNIQNAQPGFEGIAMLSVIERKTPLGRKDICRIINEKSFGIQHPGDSPFLQEK